MHNNFNHIITTAQTTAIKTQLKPNLNICISAKRLPSVTQLGSYDKDASLI